MALFDRKKIGEGVDAFAGLTYTLAGSSFTKYLDVTIRDRAWAR